MRKVTTPWIASLVILFALVLILGSCKKVYGPGAPNETFGRTGPLEKADSISLKPDSSTLKKDKILIKKSDSIVLRGRPALQTNTLAVQNTSEAAQIGGQVESVSTVSLSQLPAQISSSIFITPGEAVTWDFASITMQTFIVADPKTFVAYVVNQKTDPLKQLYIFYNPSTQKTVKMVIVGTKQPDGSIRYQYQSTAGSLYFALTIRYMNGRYEGHDRVLGNDSLDFRSLGTLIVKTPADPNVACSRTSGFGNCVTCAAGECSGSWWCVLTCTTFGASCAAGWAVSCAILNVRVIAKVPIKPIKISLDTTRKLPLYLSPGTKLPLPTNTHPITIKQF